MTGEYLYFATFPFSSKAEQGELSPVQTSRISLKPFIKPAIFFPLFFNISFIFTKPVEFLPDSVRQTYFMTTGFLYYRQQLERAPRRQLVETGKVTAAGVMASSDMQGATATGNNNNSSSNSLYLLSR